jgi:hypothetical protein
MGLYQFARWENIALGRLWPWKYSDQYKHVHYIFISCNANFTYCYVLIVLYSFMIKGPVIIYGGRWHRREMIFVPKLLLTQPLKSQKFDLPNLNSLKGIQK